MYKFTLYRTKADWLAGAWYDSFTFDGVHMAHDMAAQLNEAQVIYELATRSASTTTTFNLNR